MEYAAGGSTRTIADLLNSEGIDSPRTYQLRKSGKFNALSASPNVWRTDSITACFTRALE
jgi:hypothetical protein